jgi:hypothetical protein
MASTQITSFISSIYRYFNKFIILTQYDQNLHLSKVVLSQTNMFVTGNPSNR